MLHHWEMDTDPFLLPALARQYGLNPVLVVSTVARVDVRAIRRTGVRNSGLRGLVMTLPQPNAFQVGRQAYVDGIDPDYNPYNGATEGDKARAWVSGWKTAYNNVTRGPPPADVFYAERVKQMCGERMLMWGPPDVVEAMTIQLLELEYRDFLKKVLPGVTAKYRTHLDAYLKQLHNETGFNVLPLHVQRGGADNFGETLLRVYLKTRGALRLPTIP